jgi:hypothetical protein
MGIKDAKFYAEFESIENLAKKESYKAENSCTQYLYIFFFQYIQYFHTIVQS